MSLTPEFLAEFQIDQVTVPPTEVEDAGGFRVQSFWGFDSPPQASTRDWQLGNTVQIFEPVSKGVARVWEVTSSFGVPYDLPRIEKGGRVVPQFAADDLDSEMQRMGYGRSQWDASGWPMLTYTLSPGAESLPVILESLRESGMNVEEVLSKAK